MPQLLTALLSFIAGIYIPLWWFFAVVALLVALLIHQRGGKAFFAGFLGLFILWFVLAFWMDNANDGVLSVKIASLLPLGRFKMDADDCNCSDRRSCSRFCSA